MDGAASEIEFVNNQNFQTVFSLGIYITLIFTMEIDCKPKYQREDTPVFFSTAA